MGIKLTNFFQRVQNNVDNKSNKTEGKSNNRKVKAHKSKSKVEGSTHKDKKTNKNLGKRNIKADKSSLQQVAEGAANINPFILVEGDVNIPTLNETEVAANITPLDEAAGSAETEAAVNDTPLNETEAAVNDTPLNETAGSAADTPLDVGDSHSYSVSDNRFEVVENQLKLKDGVSLNHETDESVNVTVTTTDLEGETHSQVFNVVVADVNEAPEIDQGIADHTIAEEAVLAYQVPEDAFQDVDGDNLNFTATLADGEPLPSWLSFDPETQTFTGIPDDAEVGIISIKVIASDAKHSADATFNLEVTGVNDRPTGINLSANIVEENAEGAVIGDLTTVDVDLGNSNSHTTVTDSIDDQHDHTTVTDSIDDQHDHTTVTDSIDDQHDVATFEVLGDSLTSLTDNAAELATSMAASVAEGSLASATALYKRHTLTKRRENMRAPYTVKTKVDNKVYDHDRKMTFNNFQDFNKISALVDDNDLAKVLSKDKDYVNVDDFKELLKNLEATFPKDKETLEELYNKLNQDKNNFINPQFMKTQLIPKLKQYGISITYQKIGNLSNKVKDKFRFKKNEQLKMTFHRVIIDKKELYSKLKKEELIPNTKLIRTAVANKTQDIETLNELQNYDDWKLTQTTKDAALKFSAAISGILPIIPVDEFLRVYTYGEEKLYNEKNQLHMSSRVNKSKVILKEHENNFSGDNHIKLQNALNNVKKLKQSHMKIKTQKATAMTGIHFAAGIAKPVTDATGPIGSGIRAAVKGTSKIGVAVASGVAKYQGDKAEKEANTYTDTKNLYSLYKQIYLDEKSNEKEKEVILDLAILSFDISPNEFKLLVKSSLIESGHIKLSLSRPLDKGIRTSLEDRTYSTKL